MPDQAFEDFSGAFATGGSRGVEEVDNRADTEAVASIPDKVFWIFFMYYLLLHNWMHDLHIFIISMIRE